MSQPQVRIAQHGADRLQAGHLWVYRSDIRSAEADPGDIVRLLDDRGRFLGQAFFSDRSQIALRLLTREDRPVDSEFFVRRIREAQAYRQRVVADTDVYRVVYGEADLLPSLVVDRYGDCLAMQTLSQATERRKALFVEILKELFQPRAIVERNDPKVRLLEGLPQTVSLLHGKLSEPLVASENGRQFYFDLQHGQKTGGFLDQRENRRAAAQYAFGEALDCFTYHGGFTVNIAARCERVEAVDLSAAALEAAKRNLELNRITNVRLREANAFDLLKEYDESERRFDVVILDPPAFAKNRAGIAPARRGYKEINLRALKILRPGGYLLTCSCSHHISEAAFVETVAAAAVDARRTVVAVERRTQALDHPILLTVPETHYIKCLILRVL